MIEQASTQLETVDTPPCDLHCDVQWALAEPSFDALSAPPTADQLVEWANAAYQAVMQQKSLPLENEVTLRVVGGDEIRQLNQAYRSKDKPTNVLSFPFEVPEGVDIALLGDVIICHEVVVEQASSENKMVHQHYAHMVVHGILHLCGYDHQCDETAHEMESLETAVMAQLGLPNPYNIDVS